MKKINLPDVCLLGIDCLDVDRLAFAADICQKHIQFGQVKLLTSLTFEGRDIVPIPAISSREEYSLFMIKELYKFVDTKYVLVIQWDGFILDPFQWSDEFLEYDYIGAPWWFNDGFNVGNGGFSLRSRRLMEKVAHDDVISVYHPEDFAICRTYGSHLKECGYTFAPTSVAEKFSTEFKWNGQFGFHKTDISNWDIRKYVDEKTHGKYIHLFLHYFSDGAKNFANLPRGVVKI